MVILYMVTTWITATLWSTPYAIFRRVVQAKNSSNAKCVIENYDAKFWDVYNALQLVFTYILPLFVCVLFFAGSSCLLFLLNRLSRDTARTTDSTSINAGIRAMIGMRKQIIKTLAVSIVLFILGYTPAAVQLFLDTQDARVAAWVNDVSTLLLTLAVSLCPLLFAKFSYYYQKRVRELQGNLRNCAGALLSRISRCIQKEPVTVDSPIESPPPRALMRSVAIQTECPHFNSPNQSRMERIPTVTYVVPHKNIETEGLTSMIWKIKISQD
ncbi:7 transmembrane receptor (rhodopsin family) domain-containing protein [Ditylenchus destructor]|nr:7 transmembrane receptor (rhodopsin family) domain-containing protein [Ditylenchus destructor]